MTSKLDAEGAFIIAHLVAIIADKLEEHEELYPDEVLLNECGFMFDGVYQGVEYLRKHGYEVPMEALGFLARFIRAMEQADDLKGDDA
ncbi:hypothetical protein [Devosia sp. Naph2]|uniref:hypothetical protein n=1 Tax=Devosia polycyclovorans TaxID=3345148 RepID=UPI0035CF2310